MDLLFAGYFVRPGICYFARLFFNLVLVFMKSCVAGVAFYRVLGGMVYLEVLVGFAALRRPIKNSCAEILKPN